jgi:hypothetical protein
MRCVTEGHRGSWIVAHRRHNHSTVNGGHYTPSDWSEIQCPLCIRGAGDRGRWRTRSERLVNALPGHCEDVLL